MKKKKDFKKKSFFFDDYNESEIIFSGKNINLVKISSSRVVFLFSIFLILIFIFSIKIVYLSLHSDRNFVCASVCKNIDLAFFREDLLRFFL